ncbi:MAG TPA: ROK family protein [Actinomycetota bacterium]
MDAAPAIGVDVGGTKIAAGVVDATGNVILRRQIQTEAADERAVVAGIVKVCRELQASAPGALALGVGAAGLVDHERGVVINAPNISWRNVHLRAMLQDRLNLRVAVDNDANVAALGEALYGAGRGAGDQVMVTVGTGVGGGLVIGGRIYRGARGLGAEIGHMVIAADGPACACGNRGCLEVMASGNAIGRLARERAGSPDAAALVERAGSVEAVTGEAVTEAASAGDPFAAGVVAEAGGWLGLGVANLVNVLDPDVVIVGGGAAAGCGELLLGPARDSMAAHLLGRPDRAPPPMIPASLGRDAGLVGAAALTRA